MWFKHNYREDKVKTLHVLFNNKIIYTWQGRTQVYIYIPGGGGGYLTLVLFLSLFLFNLFINF